MKLKSSELNLEMVYTINTNVSVKKIEFIFGVRLTLYTESGVDLNRRWTHSILHCFKSFSFTKVNFAILNWEATTICQVPSLPWGICHSKIGLLFGDNGRVFDLNNFSHLVNRLTFSSSSSLLLRLAFSHPCVLICVDNGSFWDPLLPPPEWISVNFAR